MCVFDTKVVVGGCAGGSGCFAGGRRWRLRAGGDNGPAHTPASRGTHMHACMLGITCMHGALLPAPLTLECPDRAHGRTASEDVRHSRASPLGTQMLFFFLHTCLHLPFLISGCIPSPSTVGLGALSLSLSLSLSACVCQYSRKLPCYMRRHYFYVITRVQIKARMMMQRLIKGQLSSSQLISVTPAMRDILIYIALPYSRF